MFSTTKCQIDLDDCKIKKQVFKRVQIDKNKFK